MITDPSFYYTMGMVSYSLSNRTDTRHFLNKFMDIVKDDRKIAIQMRDQIAQADNVLKLVNK